MQNFKNSETELEETNQNNIRNNRNELLQIPHFSNRNVNAELFTNPIQFAQISEHLAIKILQSQTVFSLGQKFSKFSTELLRNYQ